MEIEKGMVFRGNRNDGEVRILSANEAQVQYQDIKTMRVFTVGRGMFERLDVIRVSDALKV